MIGSSASESRGESSSPADPILLSQSNDSEQNDPELSGVDAMLESGDPSTEQRTAVEREPIPSDFVNYVGQHIEATGEHLVVTPSELKKLKQKGVPSNISTTLIETTPDFPPPPPISTLC